MLHQLASYTHPALAHQGGWDEMAMLLGPVVMVVVLLVVGKRAATGDEEDGTDPGG